MYKLSDDFDTSIFVGRCLESVLFSVNTIHLNFDGDQDVSITVEGGVTYEYTDDDGRRVVCDETLPVRATQLVQLVGMTATEAVVELGVDLRLQFGNGHVLSINGSSAQYEMYRIAVGEKEFIV